MEIADEIQEKLALLKSQFLSEIISYAVSGDFDFTEYLNFDHQIEQTLLSPDELWSFNEEVDVYRKFFGGPDQLMYSQIVLVLKESSEHPLLIILNLVTRFDSLADRFCRGEKKIISTHH